MFSWFEKGGAEAGLNFSEWGLLFVSALVAIGLIGEYRKESHERWKAWNSKFELLVIIGVSGEVFFDALIFGFSGRLTAIQNIEVAALTDKAGEAYKLGNEAKERAEGLEAANLQMRKIIGDQKSRLDKHEKQLAPREVDPDDARAFVKAVNGKKRGMALIIPDDPEPRAFAVESLKPMFDKAGFVAKPEDLPGSSKYTGIVVCINSEADRVVFQELKKDRFVVRGFDDKMPERPDFCSAPPFSTAIRVFVGQRAFPPKAK